MLSSSVQSSQFLRSSPLIQVDEIAYILNPKRETRLNSRRYVPCSMWGMGQAVRKYTELRAWQRCNEYKQAVYQVCAEGPLSRDWVRRRQLEESVAGPPAHLAEGFGRFNPAEFARFAVIARSSLMESQNHLRDAVDKRYLTEVARLELDALAEIALREVTGLMETCSPPKLYRMLDGLESDASQRDSSAEVTPLVWRRPKVPNSEPRTKNPEPGTEPDPEHEPRSKNLRSSNGMVHDVRTV